LDAGGHFIPILIGRQRLKVVVRRFLEMVE
jgi:hypothetical protein